MFVQQIATDRNTLPCGNGHDTAPCIILPNEEEMTSGISGTDRERIVRRIARDHGCDQTHARRIFDETVKFLTCCAAHPKARLAPSVEVDVGWHTFLLYSRSYRAFCTSLGRFIDHEPNDGAIKDTGGFQRTFDAFKACGMKLDVELWPAALRDSAKWCSSEDCTATDCRNGEDD